MSHNVAADFVFGTSTALSRKGFIRKRKNIGVLHAYLSAGLDSGYYKPGCLLYTAGIANDLVASGHDKHWKRNPLRADDYGLQRSVGDCLGGHGFHLKKIRESVYEMPVKLPEVVGDKIVSEAIY